MDTKVDWRVLVIFLVIALIVILIRAIYLRRKEHCSWKEYIKSDIFHAQIIFPSIMIIIIIIMIIRRSL